MKIGSLFDGSGGFPLAGSLCGMNPAWAAEVEPYPIAVTKSRFPGMKHLGSVTDVRGSEIEPVDVITFGSPCQDLSIAGKRAGLKHEDNGDEETTRSGLFMEAVRIIKEMRRATNGRKPAFAVWENVPGAFSSNKGEDFRVVLQELIRIVEPQAPPMPAPDKNGWPYADCYVGDGWSLAYRVLDAQFWGVPQRRRRIYLVLNLRGQCAGEILFERKGLRGHFEAGRTAWQTAPGNPQGGSGATDSEGQCLAFSFDSLASNSMKSSNPHSGCRRVETAKTLDCFDPSPAKNQGGIAVLQPVPCLLKIRSGCDGGGKGALIQVDKSATLSTLNDQYLFQPVAVDGYNQTVSGKPGALRAGKSDGDHVGIVLQPVCYDARGNGDGKKANTLTGDHENRVTDYTTVCLIPAYCLQGNGIGRADNAGCNGKGWAEEVCYTLNTIDRPAVCFAMQSLSKCVESDVGATLLANEPSQPRNLVANVYCMAHGQANAEIMVDKAPCLNCNHEQPIVVKPQDVQYIVRRLTPTECARLQGFPDAWGHPDRKDDFTDDEYQFWLAVRNTHAAINGKATRDYTKAQILKWYNGLHTDSAEYKMWGNGIALPTALYVMQGIADALRGDDAAMI